MLNTDVGRWIKFASTMIVFPYNNGNNKMLKKLLLGDESFTKVKHTRLLLDSRQPNDDLIL